MNISNTARNQGETMKITTEKLNQAAKLIGTTDKKIVISFCIKTLIDSGVEINDAIDRVLGSGMFEKLAGNIYDELNN